MTHLPDLNQMLQGRRLSSPVMNQGRWVFGGAGLWLEIGSYWVWSHYGDPVLDSLGLSGMDASLHFSLLPAGAMQIDLISIEPGFSFRLLTRGKYQLEIKPVNAFDTTGHMKGPLRLRLWEGSNCLYEDWNETG